MKHKIYIVHEEVDFMGEIREKMIRAFACKRTAKKFINYKMEKSAALKAKAKPANAEYFTMNNRNLDRIQLTCQTNYFTLKEVVLYA